MSENERIDNTYSPERDETDDRLDRNARDISERASGEVPENQNFPVQEFPETRRPDGHSLARRSSENALSLVRTSEALISKTVLEERGAPASSKEWSLSPVQFFDEYTPAASSKERSCSPINPLNRTLDSDILHRKPASPENLPGAESSSLGAITGPGYTNTSTQFKDLADQRKELDSLTTTLDDIEGVLHSGDSVTDSSDSSGLEEENGSQTQSDMPNVEEKQFENLDFTESNACNQNSFDGDSPQNSGRGRSSDDNHEVLGCFNGGIVAPSNAQQVAKKGSSLDFLVHEKLSPPESAPQVSIADPRDSNAAPQFKGRVNPADQRKELDSFTTTLDDVEDAYDSHNGDSVADFSDSSGLESRHQTVVSLLGHDFGPLVLDDNPSYLPSSHELEPYVDARMPATQENEQENNNSAQSGVSKEEKVIPQLAILDTTQPSAGDENLSDEDSVCETASSSDDDSHEMTYSNEGIETPPVTQQGIESTLQQYEVGVPDDIVTAQDRPPEHDDIPSPPGSISSILSEPGFYTRTQLRYNEYFNQGGETPQFLESDIDRSRSEDRRSSIGDQILRPGPETPPDPSGQNYGISSRIEETDPQLIPELIASHGRGTILPGIWYLEIPPSARHLLSSQDVTNHFQDSERETVMPQSQDIYRRYLEDPYDGELLHDNRQDSNASYDRSLNNVAAPASTVTVTQLPISVSATSENHVGEEDDEESKKKVFHKLHYERLCKVCFEHKSSMTLIPCCHLCCCAHCASGISVCPLCGRRIKRTLKTYRS